MTNQIGRDWRKARNIQPRSRPEVVARIKAECNADHMARVYDMLNLVSSQKATAARPGYEILRWLGSGRMRERDGNPAEAALISGWANRGLDEFVS